MGMRSDRARAAGYRFAAVIVAGAMAALAGGAGPAPAAVAAVAGPHEGQAPGASGPVIGMALLAHFRGDGGPLAVNPSTGSVYVAEPFQKGLSVLDGQTGQVTAAITLADPPAWVAVDPATDTIYAAVDQTVAVINGRNNTLTTTITTGLPAGQLAVDPVTDTIYVSDAGSDSVTVIDGSTNTVTTTISTGHPEAAIATDPATDTSYAGSSDGTISVIDGATNIVTTTISAGTGLDAIAVNPRTDTIYSGSADAITVISGSSDTVTASVKSTAPSLAVDPQTNTVYITSQGGGVFALDGRTNNLVAQVDIPIEDFDGSEPPSFTAVNPATSTVYAAFNETGDGGGVTYMGILASCVSGVRIAPGTGCAKVAAAFQPSSASFANPAHGVVLGSLSCGADCFQPALAATSDGGQHWSFLPRPPDPGPLPTSMTPVLFTSASNGWLFGAAHTSDGGATWQQAPPIAGRRAVLMAGNATTVYATVHLPGQHDNGLLTRPADGTAWTLVPGIRAFFTGIAVSGRAAWLTSKAHLWAAQDGQHWHRYGARCPGTGYLLTRVTAASPAHLALLCTGSGKAEVLTSADGGRTVHLAGPAPVTGFMLGFASPPGNPAVITLTESVDSEQELRIYRSANHGRSWTATTFGHLIAGGFNSLIYSNRSTGWITAEGQNFLLRTTDSGRTWHKVTL